MESQHEFAGSVASDGRFEHGAGEKSGIGGEDHGGNAVNTLLPSLAFNGLALAVVWLTVFGAGVLVETSVPRFFLAPMQTLEATPTSGNPPSLTSLHRAVAQVVPGGTVSSDSAALQSSLIDLATKRQPSELMKDFAVCVFCYSPINIAILALLAGGIGGHLSRYAYLSAMPGERDLIRKDSPARARSLDQSPAISAVEGLIAYLCVVAGIYVFMDDPFKNPSSAQYLKLAGLASALAFSVGYDRTRFDGLLGIIPSPGTKSGAGAKSSPES